MKCPECGASLLVIYVGSPGDWCSQCGALYVGTEKYVPARAKSYAALRAALELARTWLANCVPVADLDGPKPLPVIDAALALDAAPE